jgi:hypothetical protein
VMTGAPAHPARQSGSSGTVTSVPSLRSGQALSPSRLQMSHYPTIQSASIPSALPVSR